jgi:integrase
MSKSIEEEPYKNVFLIQMYMGLRVGEVLALRNSDIDLKWNLLKVNKTLTTDKNGKVIMGDTTKTYAGIREVPIPEYIRGSIIEQMKVAENNKDNQLFLSPKGNYVDGRNANEILKMRLAKLGITGISTHSLRHTYGTRCVEAGMRAVALQRLMGHKDVSVTLNTYTSVFNKYKESELQKVNEYYMNNSLFNTNQLLKENTELLEEVDKEKDIEEENEIE